MAQRTSSLLWIIITLILLTTITINLIHYHITRGKPRTAMLSHPLQSMKHHFRIRGYDPDKSPDSNSRKRRRHQRQVLLTTSDKSKILDAARDDQQQQQQQQDQGGKDPTTTVTSDNKQQTNTILSPEKNKAKKIKTIDVPPSPVSISDATSQHELAGLDCDKYGGPDDEAARDEMVYWSDIPSDSDFVSPFKREGEEQYLTFEPDQGGWNNIRMAMETVMTMAHAMGRTLVIPPEQGMYLLGQDADKHKTQFTFADFFHLESVAREHKGMSIITMEEFLRRMALTGQLTSHTTNTTSFPEHNRTDWNGERWGPLKNYLRDVAHVPRWDPDKCVAAFPATTDPKDTAALRQIIEEIAAENPKPKRENYVGHPTPVDASPKDRLREMLSEREQLCLYDESFQNSRVIHFMVSDKDNLRLLDSFYEFIYFADWKQDLWTKRFVRDHFRYLDELQCAAARVVQAVRTRARTKGNSTEGIYDSLHVRRGDFQFTNTRLDAHDLYRRSEKELTKGRTLFIATDERDKSFFEPFAEKYDVCYLDDFKHLFKDLNTNYYGMLDQLIASRGDVFFGTWFSTFSGYINRLRGYQNAKRKVEGYQNGTMKSWYFFPDDRIFEMRVYHPVRYPWYMREFPTAWKDIDKGIDELHVAVKR